MTAIPIRSDAAAPALTCGATNLPTGLISGAIADGDSEAGP